MPSTIHAACGRGHLSRHERQQIARAEAFSRRTPAGVSGEVLVKLGRHELELIEELVRRDRTALSARYWRSPGSAPGEAIRAAVVVGVTEAVCSAQQEGAISGERGAQIARHLRRAQNADVRIAA